MKGFVCLFFVVCFDLFARLLACSLARLLVCFVCFFVVTDVDLGRVRYDRVYDRWCIRLCLFVFFVLLLVLFHFFFSIFSGILFVYIFCSENQFK